MPAQPGERQNRGFIEAPNNLAEQALRMMKVRMKISGSFRTMQGAQSFATLRSIIATARKQGQNILKVLAKTPAAFILKMEMIG